MGEGATPLFFMNLPTVKIHFGDGFGIINERDFDPSVHRLFDESASTVSAPVDRRAELEAMNWRELKSVAESLGIEKPEGGWESAIDQIIEKEGEE